MKSKEVLELLQITRPTLTKYVKEGIIKTITLPNGRYDYNQEDVFKLFNKGVERKTYIYARVSTPKQKKD
ncbi:resolvase, partial (plasmid) [Clostridium botulinum]